MNDSTHLQNEEDELDAILASAEDALAREIIRTSDVGEEWGAVQRRIERIRPHTRQLRIALARLDESRTGENTDAARAHCRELRLVLKELNPLAKIEFRCDQPSCSLIESTRTTCWKKTLEQMLPNPFLERLAFAPEALVIASDGLTPKPEVAIRALEVTPDVARATPSLLRQAIDLLALVAAYLQYYFIDVYLQIAFLPSIFP
jgi:hypothetical protein